jgi:chromosome partitioning protein
VSEVIAIANQKGGVGKTTTSINFAAGLACLGQDTLLIDLDPQANATSGLGFNKQEVELGIMQNLLDGEPLEKTIKATGVELLDIVCSSPDMVSAEIQLSNEVSRENRLRRALEPFSKTYEYVVIDCPPSLGLLTINALSAADKVLIPIQGEYYALEGLANFFDAIRKIQAGLNARLQLEGGVLTMFDPRFALAQQVKGELSKFLGKTLFETTIPRTVRLAEAPGFGKTIFEYDPRSKGGQRYLALAGEFLGRRGWKGMRLN